MNNTLVLDTHDVNELYIDLYISMTWSSTGNNHGVCGHLYEIFDYYFLLKEYFNVKILIGEPISTHVYSKALTDKYDVTSEMLADIITDTTFVDRPKFIKGHNILFVDGLLQTHFQSAGVVLIFKNILTFRCCKYSTHHNLVYKNIKLLQDMRVYDDVDTHMAKHYIKKINFSKYKNIETIKTNTCLIYATKNCRKLSTEQIENIITQYDYDSYLIVTDVEYKDLPSCCTVVHPPVDNLFELFDDYIYTSISKMFDCSNRLIAECKHYNKGVIYHDIDDDYLSHDTGLKFRISDVNESLDIVTLSDNDDIISIVSEL